MVILSFPNYHTNTVIPRYCMVKSRGCNLQHSREGGCMSIISEVLREELERNIVMQKSYQDEILSLPRGTMIRKKISNRDYYYLLYRDQGKVTTSYLGAAKKVDVNAMQKQIARRRYFQDSLKKLKIEEKEIRKAIG